MARPPIRILGVDPSLRATGLGLLVSEGGCLRAEEWEVVRAPPDWLHSRCLAGLYRRLLTWFRRGDVSAVALESPFGARNIQTALSLGEVRGVVLAACSEVELPVYGYAPREVKQSVAGRGGATKEQVRTLLVSILGLDRVPPLDASDALAVAVCHEHRRTQIRLGTVTPL